MRVVNSKEEMRRACRESARPLGLVPTMGALHDGHLSLVDRARSDSFTVAVSIFVNPTQFGEGEDFAEYPRDLDADLDLLRQHGTDLVFVPNVDEVYPPGFDTWVDVGPIADRLEGAARPGHFRGVATVVAKLFGIVQPERAYFGQKDGQQVAVTKRMVADLDMGIDIVVVPTVRDTDGLALSSRNVYLTTEQRRVAPVIYKALCQARKLWEEGERSGESLRSRVRRTLEQEPLIEKIDYVSVADASSLEEMDSIRQPVMVSVAVHVGRTRLIDNVLLG
jgi:pantoate--beta-alanine ligase